MNKSSDLITILMPCKDPLPTYLRESLNSVFSQTSDNWNLIVIDDHSKDEEIINILDDLDNSTDNRVTVLKNESRLITGALNTGMRNSVTPYVCSLHCDDLIAENTVKILWDYINEYPEFDYFHSSRIHIDYRGYPVSELLEAKFSIEINDFKSLSPVKHLSCWKVESALKIGGMDETLGLHGADDYDFPWSMAEAGYKFKAIPDCLYFYRVHNKNYRLTTHVPVNTQINELRKIFIKHGMTQQEIENEISLRQKGYLSEYSTTKRTM